MLTQETEINLEDIRGSVPLEPFRPNNREKKKVEQIAAFTFALFFSVNQANRFLKALEICLKAIDEDRNEFDEGESLVAIEKDESYVYEIVSFPGADEC